MKIITSSCRHGATEAGGPQAPRCFQLQGPHCKKCLSLNLVFTVYCIKKVKAMFQQGLVPETDLFFSFFIILYKDWIWDSMTSVDIFCSAASVLLLSSLCDSSDLVCKCAVNLDCVNSCSVPFYKWATSVVFISVQDRSSDPSNFLFSCLKWPNVYVVNMEAHFLQCEEKKILWAINRNYLKITTQ